MARHAGRDKTQEEGAAQTAQAREAKQARLADQARSANQMLQARGASRAGQSRDVSQRRSGSQQGRSGSTQQANQVRTTNRAGDSRNESKKSLGAFIRENIVYIGAVALVVLLVTVGIFIIKALMPVQSIQDADQEEQGFVSPYDWAHLDRTDGRYRYIVNGEVKSRLGIDVSEAQGPIDWQAVAQDGIEFAIVRLGYRGVTEGGLYVDEYYWANIDGARDAGLDCGVYFFSQADTVDEAREEADFVLEYLGNTKLEYPIGFDSEVVNLAGKVSPTADLSQDEMTAIATAFCDRIESAGYRTMLYGNVADLSRYHHDILKNSPLWWAEYGASIPTAGILINMWQYSNSGKVAGISTFVDMNIDLRGALG